MAYSSSGQRSGLSRAHRAVCGLLFGVSFGISLFAAALPAATTDSAPEYQIKAAYLLLFTRYVEWPPSSFASGNAPLIIGVLGDNPFGATLGETVAGMRSHGRLLSVLRVASPEEALQCHVVFVSAAQANRKAGWLSALSDHPVLTVTEGEAALANGAVIALITEVVRGQAKVRFDASVPAMEKAGLKISAQMLVSARKVHRTQGTSEDRQ